MQNTEEIWRLVDAKKDDFEALSDRVWGMPELCYGEFRSCAEHTAMLEQEGFRVTKDVAGIPTAVMGEAGEGGPVIAILGEYDALPGLSQEAGVAEPKPLPGNGYGHGCITSPLVWKETTGSKQFGISHSKRRDKSRHLRSRGRHETGAEVCCAERIWKLGCSDYFWSMILMVIF